MKKKMSLIANGKTLESMWKILGDEEKLTQYLDMLMVIRVSEITKLKFL